MPAFRMLALLAASAVSSLALAQPTVTGAVTTEPGKGKAVQVVTATATVQSVDPATREIVLKMPKGETHKIVAGDEVRNFDQIKAGDKVKVKYMESIAVELKKNGKAVVGRSDSEALSRAQPGQKPGGTAMREVSVTADVVGVDTQKNIVHVKNERGEIIDLQLADPAQTKLVKKGDQVQATYTEALAISLGPAAPAAPAKKK